MTVSTQTTKIIYSGNDSTTHFPITFPYINESDLGIYLTSNLDAVTKLSNTQYTYDEVNGRIVYPKVEVPALAPLATGWKLTIARETSATQDVDLVNQGPFTPQSIEESFDKSVMLIQELNEKVTRCIQYPIDQTPNNTETNGFLNAVTEAKNAAEGAAEIAGQKVDESLELANAAALSAQVAQSSLEQVQSINAFLGDITTNIQEHLASEENPHLVTKAQVGLGNVPNVDCTDPSNIDQNENFRFVTDAEKAAWGSSGIDSSYSLLNNQSLDVTLTASGNRNIEIVPIVQYLKVTLPNATLCQSGYYVNIHNSSSLYTLNIVNNSGDSVGSVLPGSSNQFQLKNNTTASGQWKQISIDSGPIGVPFFKTNIFDFSAIAPSLTLTNPVVFRVQYNYNGTAGYGGIFFSDYSSVYFANFTYSAGVITFSGNTYLVTNDMMAIHGIEEVVSGTSNGWEWLVLVNTGAATLVGCATTFDFTTSTFNVSNVTIDATYPPSQLIIQKNSTSAMSLFYIGSTSTTVLVKYLTRSGVRTWTVGASVNVVTSLATIRLIGSAGNSGGSYLYLTHIASNQRKIQRFYATAASTPVITAYTAQDTNIDPLLASAHVNKTKEETAISLGLTSERYFTFDVSNSQVGSYIEKYYGRLQLGTYYNSFSQKVSLLTNGKRTGTSIEYAWFERQDNQFLKPNNGKNGMSLIVQSSVAGPSVFNTCVAPQYDQAYSIFYNPRYSIILNHIPDNKIAIAVIDTDNIHKE